MNAKDFMKRYEQGGIKEMKELFDETNEKNLNNINKSSVNADETTSNDNELNGNDNEPNSSNDAPNDNTNELTKLNLFGAVAKSQEDLEKGIPNTADLEKELLNQEINFSGKGVVSSAAEELQMPDNVDLTDLEDEDGDSDVIPFPIKKGRTRAEFDAQCEAQKNRRKGAVNKSGRTKEDFGRTKEDFGRPKESEALAKTSHKHHIGRTREEFDRQCQEQLHREKEKKSSKAERISSTSKKKSGELFSPENFDLSKDETGFKPESRTIPNSQVDLKNTIVLSFPEGTKIGEENVLNFTKGKYTYVVNVASDEAKEECIRELNKNTCRLFAWYQERTGNKNWVVYDREQYEVDKHSELFLHVKSIPTGTLELPINASSCYKMFSNMRIDESIIFTADFDTSNIITMSCMFEGAKFNKHVYFPIAFNSKKLVDARFMFRYAHFYESFKLSEAFTAENVISAEQMFFNAKSEKDFYLSSSFSPVNAKSLKSMFGKFVCKGNFKLPELFDTSNVQDFTEMFSFFKFSPDFVLPKSFSTVNAVTLEGMFRGAVLPTQINILEFFDTCNCTNFNFMFLGTTLPNNFELPKSFSTENAKTMLRMFYGCKFPKNFILPESFSTAHAEDISELFCKCIFQSPFSLPPAFSIEGNVKKDFMFLDAKGYGAMDLGIKHIIKTLHGRYNRAKNGLDLGVKANYNGMDLPSFAKRFDKDQ